MKIKIPKKVGYMMSPNPRVMGPYLDGPGRKLGSKVIGSVGLL